MIFLNTLEYLKMIFYDLKKTVFETNSKISKISMDKKKSTNLLDTKSRLRNYLLNNFFSNFRYIANSENSHRVKLLVHISVKN